MKYLLYLDKAIPTVFEIEPVYIKGDRLSAKNLVTGKQRAFAFSYALGLYDSSRDANQILDCLRNHENPGPALCDLKEKIEALRKEIAAHESKLEKLEEKISKKEDQISPLEEKDILTEKQEARFEKLESELETLTDEETSLSDKIFDFEQAIEKIENQISDIEEERESRKEAYENQLREKCIQDIKALGIEERKATTRNQTKKQVATRNSFFQRSLESLKNKILTRRRG